MKNNTEIGKYLKKMRIDKGETMADMATKLAVSSSFLSAVETGKRKIPNTMVTKICDLYDFSSEQKKAFFEAVSESSDKIEIAFETGEKERNAIALSFATAISELSERQLEEIKNILEKR